MAVSPRSERGRFAARGAVRFCICLAVFSAGGLAGAEETSSLAFARHGESVANRDRDDLVRVSEPAWVRVHEPYEDREVGFRGVALREVLDAVYGEDWRHAEELLFTCRDGYQPTVPVARVLAHRAWLAFEREGDVGFTIRKHESGRWQRVELGPFYLVWENLGVAELLRDRDYGWPYQLVGIDLIRSADRFPRMAPPEDAPAQVSAGFRAFRVHCSRCHSLRGEGGGIGPELADPRHPVGARPAAWLRRWIDDPSQFVATARMPALNPDLPERKATLDALIAYLQAMAEAATQDAGA